MKKTLIHTVLGLLLLGVVAVVPGAPQQLPYQNPSLSVEERVEDLLGRMTVQEKALQLASFFPNANVRLGIPHIQAGEALHGVTLKHATSFPQAIAMGSTWDPDLIERMANVIAEEARAFGVHHVYSPMIGVVRDPRWGRTEESYGEDPYLVSRMAVAFIKGLQGVGDARFDSNHIIATAKHFVADGEPVAGLNGAPMDISERRLHEIFLPPFKAAVEEAGVGSIMPAHHSLNGVPCHSNHYLLVEVLREGYGFDGMIVCDNNDVLNLVTFMRVADSKEAAARLALEVGIDTELAWEQGWDIGRAYGAPLVNAVKNQTIPMELLDRAVRNVLTAKFRLGLFDDGREVLAWRDFELSGDKGKADYVQTTYAESVRGDDGLNEYFERADRLGTPRDDLEQVLADPEHDKLALEVARKAITLLKNDGDLLPLEKQNLKTIAVLGPNANIEVLGGYSTPEARHFVTVLDGIRRYVGGDVEVVYEEGCSLVDLEQENIEAAVAAARNVDVAIVVVGGNELTTNENEDRDDLALVGHQQRLIEEVVGTGTPVIVVLLHGRPLAVEWVRDHVPAILDGWYLGQETGTAVAEALFGEINPGGKLPVTIPRNVGQVPINYNMLAWGRTGRYFESAAEPLWPFGYGLSYTTFEYSNLRVVPSSESPTLATATVDVTNTGVRAGDEIVQLYVKDEYGSVVRPAMELKGFRRITLSPGETRTVTFSLDESAFAFYDEKTKSWIVEPGAFDIMIGSSSRDIRATTKIEL